jgi:hypothetical protein
MFGDFIYHNYSEDNDSLEYQDDSARVADIFKAYKVFTMEQVRKENYEIRRLYHLSVDSLAFDNYWIQINRINGNMVRDTLWMADLDSAQYMPSLTAYNITYKGRLNIDPTLQHEMEDFIMENLMEVEISDSAIIFEVRDREVGQVKKKGTIIILNSIGYPLELSFYYSYRNVLLDMLYQKRP